MPKVKTKSGIKEIPYTKKGKKAAKKLAKKVGKKVEIMKGGNLP